MANSILPKLDDTQQSELFKRLTCRHTMAATFDWWRTEVTQVIITGNVFIPKTFSIQRIEWWNWYWDKICFESICIVYECEWECECEFVYVCVSVRIVFNGTFNENKNGTSRIRTIPSLILWSKENKKSLGIQTSDQNDAVFEIRYFRRTFAYHIHYIWSVICKEE